MEKESEVCVLSLYVCLCFVLGWNRDLLDDGVGLFVPSLWYEVRYLVFFFFNELCFLGCFFVLVFLFG